MRALIKEAVMSNPAYLSCSFVVVFGLNSNTPFHIDFKPLKVQETNQYPIYIENGKPLSPSLKAVDLQVLETIPVVDSA